MANWDHPNYSATESERTHKIAMQLGSEALLNRLRANHPAIIARLIERQQEKEDTK